MPESSRGYLTMAVGDRHYLEMAIDMALSLREHTDHPVAIGVDEQLADQLEARYPGVFDEIGLVPPEFRDGRALKYGAAAVTPYDETAFVDADCIVLGSLDHVWASLEQADMAFLGELLTADDDENHHGFSTLALMRRFRLDRYLKTNSGLFCFRRDPAREILAECLECFKNEARPSLRWRALLGAWLGDEIAIGIVGGRRRLSTLPKPGEMYWPNEFGDIDLDSPTKPLLHMIWPLPDATLEEMTRRAGARRTAHSLPDDGGSHWRLEQSKLERMAARRRLLERLKIWE